MIPPEIFDASFKLQVDEHKNWCDDTMCHAHQIFMKDLNDYGDALHFHHHVCQILTCHVYILLEKTLTSITGQEVNLS